MGLCYTFKHDHQINQTEPGSGNGLTLFLGVNQFQYTFHPPRYGNPNAGVKVHIHPPMQPPEVEKFGLSVPTGQAGHIVVNRKEKNLMYPPWGICDKKKKKLHHHKMYSLPACMSECAAGHIIKTCKCKPYWEQQYNVSECDAFQILDCAGPAEAEFRVNFTVERCKCNQPCSFVVYKPIVSYSTFPNTEIGEVFAREVYENSSDQTYDSENGNDIKFKDPSHEILRKFRENHVMLDIYYDSLSHTRITQSKAVTEISLMSDMGGLLGLWLGISLVTLGEFIELAMHSLKYWLGYDRHTQTRNTQIDYKLKEESNRIVNRKSGRSKSSEI